MRGVLSASGYVPYRRLQRASISAFLGTGGGRGTRSVASHDEDTTTMAVEAARLSLRSINSRPGASGAIEVPDVDLDALWFVTTSPAYLDKTNACAVHAALRLPRSTRALDAGGAIRSAAAALATALESSGSGTTLVAAADLRDGLPGGPDESAGGDGAAAILIGEDSPRTPVIAEYLGGASATEEVLDRWRAPADRRSRTWEERFGETRYLDLGADAWQRGLKNAGIEASQVDRVAVTSMHARAAKSLAGRLGVGDVAVVDDLSGTVGQTGAAHPLLLLASMLESAKPGEVVALVHLADGAEVLILRTTEAIARLNPVRPIAAQVAAAADLPYGKFLAWRDMLTPEPPRRPDPQRVSSTAAWRSEDFKFGFVGSRDRTSGAVHLPPSRVSMRGGAVDDMEPVAISDRVGTIATFTVDRLAYSPSPPIVFALVDFEGGGRFPVELTDVDADTLTVGDRVEMTFRRLFTADGIHDYFWKARPVRG
jgi:hydroxymethylglutaryl-CoA synthase